VEFFIRLILDDFAKKQISTAKYIIKSSPILLNWQGAQILSDDTYFSYVEETKDEAQPKAEIEVGLFTKPSIHQKKKRNKLCQKK